MKAALVIVAVVILLGWVKVLVAIAAVVGIVGFAIGWWACDRTRYRRLKHAIDSSHFGPPLPYDQDSEGGEHP